MPKQPERLEELLDLLYLAAAEPSAWPDFLTSLARVFEAHVAVFIAQRAGDLRYTVGAYTGISSETVRRYDEYYNLVDPWFLALNNAENRPSVARGSDLCPLPRFRRSEFYNDYWKQSASLYQIGMFQGDPDSSAVLSLHRARTQQDFTDENLRLLRRLLPHFRRALAVHRKVVDLNSSLAHVAGAVNALDVALVGLGPQRRIRFRNGAAEALLRAGDFLVERNGRLVLRDSQAELHLHRLLAAAATRSLSTLPGGFLNVSHAGRSLLLTVLPAHRYAAVGADPLAALLLIIDPDARPKSRSLLLSQLFHLTPAESRVVMLLLEGLDPNAIAARTHTTAGTVRFQLKAVYRKLGVARQSQLIRLVSRIPGVPDPDFLK
ncbi:MAG: helix-turn-helix transcriptional regulator [Bryobacteraceae bacterium]|nr:helix-turn-helix transcriptional regulator [Bryobacteraceae bacterium]